MIDITLIIDWVASSGLTLHKAGHWTDPVGNTVARCTEDLVELARVSVTGPWHKSEVTKIIIRDWNRGGAGRKMMARWPSNYLPSTSYTGSRCACCGGLIPKAVNKWRMNGESICAPCMDKWKDSGLELAVFRKLLSSANDAGRSTGPDR